MDETQMGQEEWIAGRNAVLEALKSGRELNTVFLAKDDPSGTLRKIAAMAKAAGITVKPVDVKKLSSLIPGASHQGVAASVACTRYAEVEEIFALAEQRGEAPFLLIADEIEDPHNLGALIRTAEASGVHGVILPKRRSASLTSAVHKTSAGAVSHMLVARVSNLAAELDALKKRGVWLYGADMDGEDWCSADYAGPVGLVVGSEGRGLSRLVRDKCDFIVSLPMLGKVNSLNASVAGGILMYEVARQRLHLPAKK